MTNARDKANIPVLNFQSKGIDDNADATAITIDSSENVGIGTTSPQSPLHVIGTNGTASLSLTGGASASSVTQINAVNETANTWNILEIRGQQINFDTASSERMRISSDGKVGIGTSSPNSKLTVSDADTAFVYVEENTGDIGDTAGILFKTSAADGFLKSGMILEDDGTTYARGKLHIVQNSTANNSNATVSDAKITILNDGNVGIGTTSPTGILECKSLGNTQVYITAGNSSASELFFGDEADVDVGKVTYLHSSNSMKFQTNTSEAMRIDSSGNLSIGHTTSGGSKLAVCDGANAQIQFFPEISTDTNLIQHYDPTASAYMASDNRASQYLFKIGTSEKMRISSAGKVSIGTSTAEGILKLDNTGQTSETLLTLEDTGGSGAHSQITLKNTTGTVASLLTNSDNLEFRVDDETVFSNISGSEHMRITSGGLVGIGTTSPGSPLTVSGGTNSTVAFLNNTVSATTDLQNILLLQSNTSGSAGVGHGVNIAFNAERNDGNNQRYGDFGFSANTNSGTSLKTDCIIKLMGGHEVLRLKQTSPNNTNEMIAPDLLTTGTTSNRYPLYWVHNGTVGSIQPYTGSVREMKTDINDMSSVDWIHSLRPRSFKFRDFETNEDGSKTYLETTNDEPNTEYGLIAEEVNEVNGSDYILDKQTDEDGNENLKGVLYHNLVPVLLKAVQEQKNTIQELEARITTLEANNP